MENTARVARNLRLLREKYHYSQDYVARKIGIKQKPYSKMETGHTRKIAPERLKKLAELYPEEGEELDKYLQSDAKLTINHNNNTYREQSVSVSYSETTHLHQISEQEREQYKNQIARLESQVAHLEEEVRFLRKIIDKEQTA